MSEAGRRIVRGSVALPPGAAERARAVRVVVEDVSRLDAPSTVVGEQRMEDVELAGAIPFEVDVPGDRVDPRRRYSVRVHVDVTGSGEVSKGDYVSTASHPVLAKDEDEEVVVDVRRI